MNPYDDPADSAGTAGGGYATSWDSAFYSSVYVSNIVAAYEMSYFDSESFALCTPANPRGLLSEKAAIGRSPLVEIQNTSPQQALEEYERILSAPLGATGAFAIGDAVEGVQLLRGLTVAGALKAYEYFELGWKLLFENEESRRK